MAMVFVDGTGKSVPTKFGAKPAQLTFNGTCRQADFTTTGAVAKLGLPIGSVIFFTGTRNAAATEAGLGIIRVITTNDTYADYYTLDGVALGTLVTD